MIDSRRRGRPARRSSRRRAVLHPRGADPAGQARARRPRAGRSRGRAETARARAARARARARRRIENVLEGLLSSTRDSATSSSRTTCPSPASRGGSTCASSSTFTIDPETAKDFDDAISSRREGDGIRVWVHIADVSCVRARRLAARPRRRRARAVSSTCPGCVAPMLPHELADDVCSPAAERRPALRHRRDALRRLAAGRRADLLPLGDPQRTSG